MASRARKPAKPKKTPSVGAAARPKAAQGEKTAADKAAEKAALKKYREICDALPGSEERISWGFPNHRVGGKKGKMFAGYGTGHGGPHIVFKVSDDSAFARDKRYVRVNDVGSWKGYEDWWFYFFDWKREDDWDALKGLLEVSWEIVFATLPKKLQAEILPP